MTGGAYHSCAAQDSLIARRGEGGANPCTCGKGRSTHGARRGGRRIEKTRTALTRRRKGEVGCLSLLTRCLRVVLLYLYYFTVLVGDPGSHGRKSRASSTYHLFILSKKAW